MAANTSSLLEAGALLPVKQKVPKDEIVDTVSARSYSHPALGDRVVVRLTADSVAQGDDLAMEYRGFESPEVTGPVAQRRRQALGFPAAALINDPKNAHYALEVVKLFRKAARRSKAKPGHGFDEFAAIAKTLGRSVAHFLPSFWETVGREFIALGNRSYASRSFTRAREAERVHALKIDEEVRLDAFLEFALAGCLTAKSLMEYAADLQKTMDTSKADARHAMLEALMACGPEAIWQDDGAAVYEGLRTYLAASASRRLRVPPEFVDRLDKVLDYTYDAGELVSALGDPSNDSAFTADKKWEVTIGKYGTSINIDGEDEEMMDDKGTFNSDVLFASAAVIPMLFHELPVGDPARKAVVDAYDACVRCL